MNAIVASVLARGAAKARTTLHPLALIALFCGGGFAVSFFMASMGLDLGAELF